jgi:hypothetical protein
MIAIKKAAAGVPTAAPKSREETQGGQWSKRAINLTQPNLDSDHCSGRPRNQPEDFGPGHGTSGSPKSRVRASGFIAPKPQPEAGGPGSLRSKPGPVALFIYKDLPLVSSEGDAD